MENIKMINIHQYVLNEGIDEIIANTKHFQRLLSVLPNNEALQKAFVPVVTNLLRPGIEHRHAAISFMKMMVTAIEGFLGRIGLSLNATLIYPQNLLKLGVVGIATIIIKLFDILMLCIRKVEHKTTTKEEFDNKLKQLIMELKRSYN